MKKLSFIALLAALVALSGCAGGLKPIDRSQTIGSEKQSIAERSSKTKAQQTISSVGVPATLGAYRTANNAELAKIEANMGELYTLKADKSCFATESTFNACFDLTWATGGSYALPTAAADTLGGVKVGSRLTISDGVLSADVQTGEGSMVYPGAGVPVSTGSAWGTSLAASSFLVGDCTAGPCLDGTSDGGNIIKLYAGTGSYWTALQGGAPAANRSWRLPIAAAPSAGTTRLMNMDEYGQMGFVDPATFLTPSGVGGALTVTASGFDGNLATTDNTLQEIAQKFDDYTGGGTYTSEIGQDMVGLMVMGNTETGIAVTYDDADGTLDFVVNFAAPGAIGGTTPAAGTFTTLAAGASGLAVDADGDVTAKSFSTTRTTAAQAVELYEGSAGGSNKVTIAPSTALSADKTIVAETIVQTSDFGSGVGTFLTTPSSTNLASAVTGETGSGALVFGTSPTLTTPALGTPSSLVLTNATGLPAAAVGNGFYVMDSCSSVSTPATGAICFEY